MNAQVNSAGTNAFSSEITLPVLTPCPGTLTAVPVTIKLEDAQSLQTFQVSSHDLVRLVQQAASASSCNVNVQLSGGQAILTLLNVDHISSAATSSGATNVLFNAGIVSGTNTTDSDWTETDDTAVDTEKEEIKKHPLFEALVYLFERVEKCGLAMQSNSACSVAVDAYLQQLIKKIDTSKLEAFSSELNDLMIKGLQVLRIHLMELEKVNELSHDFCERYLACLQQNTTANTLLGAVGDSAGNEEDEEYEWQPITSHLDSNVIRSCAVPMSVAPVSVATSSTAPATISTTPQKQPITNILVEEHPTIANLQGTFLSSGTVPVLQLGQIHKQPGENTDNCSATIIVNANLCPINLPLQTNSLGSLTLSSGGTILLQQNSNFPSTSNAIPIASRTEGTSGVVLTSNIHGYDSDKSKRGKRGSLPRKATEILKSWLFQHIVHPYPTEDEKRVLGQQCRLSLLQVNNWFINARRRILQPMLSTSSNSEQSNADSVPVFTAKSKVKSSRPSNLSAQRFWPEGLAQMPCQSTDKTNTDSKVADLENASVDGVEISLSVAQS